MSYTQNCSNLWSVCSCSCTSTERWLRQKRQGCYFFFFLSKFSRMKRHFVTSLKSAWQLCNNSDGVVRGTAGYLWHSFFGEEIQFPLGRNALVTKRGNNLQIQPCDPLQKISEDPGINSSAWIAYSILHCNLHYHLYVWQNKEMPRWMLWDMTGWKETNLKREKMKWGNNWNIAERMRRWEWRKLLTWRWKGEITKGGWVEQEEEWGSECEREQCQERCEV